MLNRPFSESSIRVRLVILFAIIVLPLLASRTFELRRDGSAKIEAAGEHALTLALRAIERQRDLISDIETLLEVLARVPDVRAGNPEDCRRFLATATDTKRWLKGLWALETSGVVTCSTVPGGVGLDFGATPYFRKAVETKSFVMDNYLVGRSGAQPAAVAMLPVMEGGEVAKVMMASLDMAWLGAVVEEVTRKEDASVLLVDSKGTVLIRRPDLLNITGRNVAAHKLAQAVVAKPQGMLESEGVDGVMRIYGFARLPGTDATLAIGLSKREILGDINRQIWFSLVSFGLVSLLGSLAAWFGGEAFLSRPIRDLATTAARFGAGDYSVRAPISARRGEFGILAAALNEMAEELEAREGKLKATADRMAMLAENDALTGLPNRRLFDRRLFSAWGESTASGQPLSLLLIDVDHFKALNDTHGHIVGDRYLQSISRVLGRVATGHGRLAARFGGEEFAVLLPDADAARACEIAEDIRATVEALHAENCETHPSVLTVSIGVAARLASPEKSPAVLVENADAALYAAKRLGRNRVVASTEVDLATQTSAEREPAAA